MLFFALPVVILIGWCLSLLLHEISQRMTCSCCKNGSKRIQGLYLFSLLLTFPTCFAARSSFVCFLCLRVFCVYWLSLFFRPMSGGFYRVYIWQSLRSSILLSRWRTWLLMKWFYCEKHVQYTEGSRQQSSAPLKSALLLCCHVVWNCSATATGLTDWCQFCSVVLLETCMALI